MKVNMSVVYAGLLAWLMVIFVVEDKMMAINTGMALATIGSFSILFHKGEEANRASFAVFVLFLGAATGGLLGISYLPEAFGRVIALFAIALMMLFVFAIVIANAGEPVKTMSLVSGVSGLKTGKQNNTQIVR